ncbi:hypothetical protein SCANM63S_03633 [Streptomyces canarius]
MVVEQRPDAARGVGEGVLVGREDLGGGEPADPLQGVEVVAEGIGDRRVVGVLVQADVRGDLRQQVVAAEQAPPAGQSGRVLLLQVQADVARRVPRVQIARSRRPGRSRSSPGTISRSGRAGERPGRVRARGARSGATCSSGAPAAVSLAAMYENHRPGRVSRVRRTIAASAACSATQAPDASRTRADRPWWSGWWWVMTTPWTSPTAVPQAASPATSVSQVAGVVPAGVDQHRAPAGVHHVHQRVAEGVVRDGHPDGPYAPAVIERRRHPLSAPPPVRPAAPGAIATL